VPAQAAAPFAAPILLPMGILGAAYSQALSDFGGTPPYTWSIGAGVLPPGLSVRTNSAGTGVISGTPTAPGTWGFVLTITDAALAKTSKSMSITISSEAVTPSTLTKPESIPTLAIPALLPESNNQQPSTTKTLPEVTIQPVYLIIIGIVGILLLVGLVSYYLGKRHNW
jgi:hypothetical protein